MFEKIVNSLSRMKTIHLVMLPVLSGLVPIFIFLWLGSAGYRDTSMQYFLLILTFFLWGFMGLPMIIRKEVPWLITIRGWPAVAEGILLVLIWWGVAIGFVGLMLHTR